MLFRSFTVDLALSEQLAFFRYTDRPGVVGLIGGLLGEGGVNIAGMQVSRSAKGGEALVALTLDSGIPPEILAEISDAIGASWGRSVSLD